MDANQIPFRLSQGQLNLLETCPRKFQHIYIDQLGSPTSPEQQESLAWGSRFHLLMQQRELGLSVDQLVAEDEPLQRCLTAFTKAAPEILFPHPQTFRQSEHRRTLNFQGYLLTVIYDLLILDQQQAQILDWKTYPRPQNQRWLAQDWQTRLYLFVLAETSDYSPEQISMTYWFVKPQDNQGDSLKPQSLKFPYNRSLHDRTHQDLHLLLNHLTNWLKRYEETAEPFPQVVETEDCDRCHFTVRCQRHPEMQEHSFNQSWLPDLAEVQEVSL